MPNLQIDLQEVFLDDLVVVWINDVEICRGRYNTRFQIGLAHTVQKKVPAETAQYRINLPERQLTVAGEVEMSRDKYLGVTLSDDGRLEARESIEPFRYM